MKHIKIILSTIVMIVFVVSLAVAASLSLTWDPPATYTDGTTLPLSDIDHYTVYWGTSSAAKTNIVSTGTSTNLVILNLTKGSTIYAIVTATTISSKGGMESVASNEASKVVPHVGPGAVRNLKFN